MKVVADHQPHPSWGGWENFLKSCEIRDQHDGVVFYGKTNCNYIVFPDGTLVENFAFHGRNLMAIVREKGAQKTLDQILEQRKIIKDILATIAKP